MPVSPQPSPLYSQSMNVEEAAEAGFRFGSKGTHTSRTIMFAELSGVLAGPSPSPTRADYAAAIVEGNALGKVTAATRRLTNQRLGELYALDPDVPVFRMLRRLWAEDESARPLLALQCAIARDPLLAITVAPMIDLPPGAELQRDTFRAALRKSVSGRLNDATLEKVLRNISSSWSQSGHLEGRTFKRRRRVSATPVSVTFGSYLARVAGFRGAQLFGSGWVALLDCTPARARELALEAKRMGLIDLRVAGEVVDISFERLERAG
jgi:hypothetical protein